MSLKKYMEKIDKYKNYLYIILLFDDGHRCGYVQLPDNHKYCNLHYDNIDIKCHGGLTYSNTVSIDNVDEPFFSKGFWIGFDTAHCEDIPDIQAVIKYFGKSQIISILANSLDEYIGYTDSCVKDLIFVENECKSIIDQLIKV